MPTTINISETIRTIDAVKRAVFTDVADALKDGIMEEFDKLLIETAQYTGTTTASWRITLGGLRGDTGIIEQPKRSKKTALSKGHMAAVKVAQQNNVGALDNLVNMLMPGQKGQPGKIGYKAIMVENNAPGADTAEHGMVRDVNKPAGAAARFEERVASKNFEIIRDRII